GTMDAVWADLEHNDGQALVAALDSWSEETGGRRIGNTLRTRLLAPGARERYDFNVELMRGRDDLDLGFTPDVPGSPGLLPLEVERISRVVSHLNVQATTDLAVRVLSTQPASVRV